MSDRDDQVVRLLKERKGGREKKRREEGEIAIERGGKEVKQTLIDCSPVKAFCSFSIGPMSTKLTIVLLLRSTLLSGTILVKTKSLTASLACETNSNNY